MIDTQDIAYKESALFRKDLTRRKSESGFFLGLLVLNSPAEIRRKMDSCDNNADSCEDMTRSCDNTNRSCDNNYISHSGCPAFKKAPKRLKTLWRF
jgi:hypothetical protein